MENFFIFIFIGIPLNRGGLPYISEKKQRIERCFQQVIHTMWKTVGGKLYFTIISPHVILSLLWQKNALVTHQLRVFPL